MERSRGMIGSESHLGRFASRRVLEGERGAGWA